jgi:hypothetical protein
MTAWWNLPFAVLVGLALWCRLAAAGALVAGLGRVLGFFGVSGAGRQAAADFLGIAGVTGLLFVGWADQLAVAADAWLAVDALLSSLGLGLLGAWVLGNLGAPDQPSGPVPEEMPMHRLTMMDVEEVPVRGGAPGSGPGPYP